MNKVLYNVTISVDESVHLEWLEWMKNKHIPDVMATGYFLENRICRIHAFEEGGISYAIQYICRNMSDYEEYQAKEAPVCKPILKNCMVQIGCFSHSTRNYS